MLFLASWLDLKLCSMICLFFLFGFRFRQITCRQEWVSWNDRDSMKLLVYTSFDIVKSTYRLIESVESLRQKHVNKPSFEVGYVMFTIFEKYRKMVDKYNTSIFMGKQLFTMELVLYLEQVENHYWEIEHLTSMLHEIERKYGVTSPLDSKYTEMTSDELKAIQAKAKATRLYHLTMTAHETKKIKIKQKIIDRMSPTRRTTTPRPYNFDYAIQRPWVQSSAAIHKVLNDSIYKELSWSAKLLLLKDLIKTHGTTEATKKRTTITTPMSFAAESNLDEAVNYPERVAARRFSRSASLRKNPMIKAKETGPKTGRRIPGIEALVAGPKDGRRMLEDEALEEDLETPHMTRMEGLAAKRRQDDTTKVTNDDDNSMRLKLFRLMYETIKDSDMKCKRAELIRAHYENSSSFEIGYLMGDVMDKYNIMSDISMTLNRLFHEWKPIEHINAYEQISNQAIEINHLIDMMKGISKKDKSENKDKNLK